MRWWCRASLFVFTVGLAVGCSEGAEPADPPPLPDVSGDAPVAELLELDRGVPARGNEPAILAVDVEGVGVCAGALVAPSVVLTARRCVSSFREGVPRCTSSQSAVEKERQPAKLALFAGDDLTRGELVARGRSSSSPTSRLCGFDVASSCSIARSWASSPGAAPARRRVGDRVRTIGFGLAGGEEGAPSHVKLRREALRVSAASESEFAVTDALCGQSPGMLALDPDSGAIVGVFSGAGAGVCEGRDARDVYTRVDAHLALVEHALLRAQGVDAPAPPPPGPSDAGPPIPVEPPPGSAGDAGGAGAAAMGEPCQRGADCATAVCASYGGERYCSRECGGGKRCPAGYRCTAATNGMSVCKRNE